MEVNSIKIQAHRK